MDPEKGSAASAHQYQKLPLSPKATPEPGNGGGPNQENGLGTAGSANSIQNLTPKATPEPGNGGGLDQGNGLGSEQDPGQSYKRQKVSAPTEDASDMPDLSPIKTEYDDSPPNNGDLGAQGGDTGSGPVSTLMELSKGCGASIPLFEPDECLGFARTGMKSEALIRQGPKGYERYRLVPSKAVTGVSMTGAVDLVKDQLALKSSGEHTKFGREDFVNILRVAWRDRDAIDTNPLAAIMPGSAKRFPVTRVYFLWKSGATSWETRSTFRRFFPKETADKLIYARAREVEIRYREKQGLPVADIPQLTTEDAKPPPFAKKYTRVAIPDKASTTPKSVTTKNGTTPPPTTDNSSGEVTDTSNRSVLGDARSGDPPPPTPGNPPTAGNSVGSNGDNPMFAPEVQNMIQHIVIQTMKALSTKDI